MALIAEECLRRVQEATDIVALAESYGLKLKRTGSSFLALCPFHNEKTPSFNINPQMQIFKCFGCGVGGGVFKFVQLMERCEFVEAVELCAQRGGIELVYDGRSPSGAPGQAEDKRKPLRWANKIAFDYFRAAYNDPQEGRIAREYLNSRGFTPETIEAWGLGWSPDRWDGLLQYYIHEVESRGGAHKKERALQVGVEAGIFRHNDEADRTYDAFRGRVMFPILDMQMRPIGFGGRVLEEKPEAGGKYLNTSETAIFQKRSLLFGLNMAAKEIGLTRTAYVVEGYVDTIMCHQYGIRNVVATLGTSLTSEHVKLLRRYIQGEGRVVALFDNDNAGRKATDRAIEIFMEEGVNLHVLQNLEVKDAGEFLPKFGAEAFQQFLTTAKDSFSYVLEKELGQDFAGDFARKAAAVESVMSLVNRCPNAIRREMMRQRVAEVAGVAEANLPKPEKRNDPARPPSNQRGLQAVNPTGQDGQGGGRGEYVPAGGYAGQGAAEGFAGARRQGERGRKWKKKLQPGEVDLSDVVPPPVILDPRREGRLRAEKRLLHYIYEDPHWCRRVCSEYPPQEWFDPGLHGAATLLRNAWQAALAAVQNTPEHPPQRPRLEDVLLSVVDEAVRERLIDLIDHDKTAKMGEDELGAILNRVRIESLEERKSALAGRRHAAEAAGNREEMDRVLLEKIELDRMIRQLGGR